MTGDAPLILVIEDELPIRRFLRASLSGEGYRLAEAETGQQGLSMSAAQPPDLIILDLGLPDMDGLQIIEDTASLVSGAHYHFVGAWSGTRQGDGPGSWRRRLSQQALWHG